MGSGSARSLSESDEADAFVSSLDKEAIRSIALAVRGGADLTCTVGESPAVGAYNVVLPLDFSDSVRWAIRIPMEADWTDLRAREMRQDVLAQQYIAARVPTVPIPAIHAFSCTRDPLLGHPYMITDFARGIQLSGVWDDAEWWAARAERYTKHTVLESVARHMVVLSTLTFDRIGRLDCDSDGMHIVGPIPSLGFLVVPPVLPEGGFGPFASTQQYLRGLLDAYCQDANPQFVLLRMLLSILPDARFDGPPFTFAPPDFNPHNLLIDPDTGEVTAFIDWDGVAIEPRQLGALGYPTWLLRDWNPIQKRAEGADEMHALRTFYADAVTRFGGSQCGEVTRNSHILLTYAGAICGEMSRFGNLQHLGKLVFGSYMLTYELLEGIERSAWLTAKPDTLLQVPAEGEDDSESDESVPDAAHEVGGESPRMPLT
ncbi:hypothetical protein AURDEDRAFT_145777 [Auricularia subglabra TFB-10046 SS5]|nr:hypothetical protein AURDEDRAFT_145777 [Auricularia subglabra TFB-10046 SS5]